MSKLGKTNAEFNLIEEGDKILVGLSGGKDSLTMVHAMKEQQRRAPFKFEFLAVTVSYGMNENFDKLKAHCEEYDIPHEIYDTNIYDLAEDKIRKIMKIAKEPISMETPIGDDDDSHLGDFIEDNNTLAPADAALHASMRNVVKDVLDSLTPREAKVLRMRFGVEMSTDHTLEEVGKQFDVTRERIRQIEAKALRKLRHPSRSDKLKSFLEGN